MNRLADKGAAIRPRTWIVALTAAVTVSLLFKQTGAEFGSVVWFVGVLAVAALAVATDPAGFGLREPDERVRR